MRSNLCFSSELLASEERHGGSSRHFPGHSVDPNGLSLGLHLASLGNSLSQGSVMFTLVDSGPA